MSWNYRIVREKGIEEDYYSIREVYYADDNKIVNGFTSAIIPSGENVEELIKTLEHMLADAKMYGVINYEDVIK